MAKKQKLIGHKSIGNYLSSFSSTKPGRPRFDYFRNKGGGGKEKMGGGGFPGLLEKGAKVPMLCGFNFVGSSFLGQVLLITFAYSEEKKGWMFFFFERVGGRRISYKISNYFLPPSPSSAS